MNTEIRDLMSRIEKCHDSMSKGQKAISDYITKNYEKAAFMTASKLGNVVGVSESTVSRYAVLLGYNGYPELQKAFQGMIKSRLTTLQRMELSVDADIGAIVKNVLKADINNIKNTLEQVDISSFDRIVKLILGANRVFLLGLRSAAPVVEFMGYYMGFMMDNVFVVTSGVKDVLEQMVHLNEGDVLITVSFPRYAKRAVDATELARSRGAKVIVITDSVFSPLIPISDEVLYAHSDMASFVDSLVAPLSLINALLLVVSTQSKEKSMEKLEYLEGVWNKYGVYAHKEVKNN